MKSLLKVMVMGNDFLVELVSLPETSVLLVAISTRTVRRRLKEGKLNSLNSPDKSGGG